MKIRNSLSILALVALGVYQSGNALTITLVNNTPYNFTQFVFTPCGILNDYYGQISLPSGGKINLSTGSRDCWWLAGIALSNDSSADYNYEGHIFNRSNYRVFDANDTSQALYNLQDNKTYYLTVDASGKIVGSQTPSTVAQKKSSCINGLNLLIGTSAFDAGIDGIIGNNVSVPVGQYGNTVIGYPITSGIAKTQNNTLLRTIQQSGKGGRYVGYVQTSVNGLCNVKFAN